MKKWGSLFLAFVLCLSLCACTEKGGDVTTTTSTEAVTTTTSMRLTGPDTIVTTTTETVENVTTTTTEEVTTTATEATATTTTKVTTTATKAPTTTTTKAPTTTTKATTTTTKAPTTTTTVATTTTTAPAQNLNPKENAKQDVEYLGYFRVSGDSLLASALMFSGDACVVTDRYFTKEKTESIAVVFNGVTYYSEGGGFTPYHYQLTDTELIVTGSFYEEGSADGDPSIKAVMLSDGTFKITFSKKAEFPVGTILSTNIDDVI